MNSIYNFIPSIQRWIESEIKWKEVVQAVEKIQLAACSMSTNTVEMHPIYLGFFVENKIRLQSVEMGEKWMNWKVLNEN